MFVGGGVMVGVVLVLTDGDTVDEGLLVTDELTLVEGDPLWLVLPLVLPLEDALTLVDEETL